LWGVLDTAYVVKFVCFLAAGRWSSLDAPSSSTSKTERHDIAEIKHHSLELNSNLKYHSEKVVKKNESQQNTEFNKD
jgi:hypothetical protein